MAQELTVQIKTTSDVPEAMNKAKAATSGFDKQVEGIAKKFAGSFKDIFLSFLGPMALVGATIGYISSLIDRSIQRSKDAISLAIEGSSLIESGQSDLARQNARDEEVKKAKEDAAAAPQANAAKAQDLGKGDAILKQMIDDGKMFDAATIILGLNRASTNKAFQDTAAKMATESQKASGVSYGKEFTAPNGFSNVIGVGANPVIEAMTAQLEEARIHTALLEQIANRGYGEVVDFTKEPQRYPGRGSIPQ